MPAFDLWNDGTDIPVFAWQLREGYTDKWNLYHLSERLRLKGWLIPAYPMPEDLTDIIVQRIVVRNGLSRNLAESLLSTSRRPSPTSTLWSRRCRPRGRCTRSRTEPRLRLDDRRCADVSTATLRR